MATILAFALTGGPGSLTVTPGRRAPARATVPKGTPEWISPPGCLPHTDRQVAEQRNGYSSPGRSLITMIIVTIQGMSR